MTFNAAIPAATDLISQSQSQIQTNFSQSNTAFGIDHTAFDVVSNQGKHKKSTYVEQAADPATSANEVALYSKDLAAVSTLFLRKESNGTVVQMSGQDPTAAAAGSTFLPGGIIMKWGTVSAATANPITFASAFPNNCWSVVAQPINSNAATVANDYVYIYSVTTSGFSATGVRRTSLVANTSFNYFYIAVGN